MTRNLYPTSISIAFLYLYYLYGSLAFVPSGKLYRTSFPCWRKISHNDCPRQWSVQSMLMNSPEKTEMVPDVGDAQGSDDDDDIDMVEQLGRGSAKVSFR